MRSSWWIPAGLLLLGWVVYLAWKAPGREAASSPEFLNDVSGSVHADKRLTTRAPELPESGAEQSRSPFSAELDPAPESAKSDAEPTDGLLFSVEGSVLSGLGEGATVACSAISKNGNPGPIEAVEVEVDGTWGMEDLEFHEGMTLQFELTGGGLIRETRTATVSGRTRTLRVAFDGEQGVGAYFFPTDADGEPVFGAHALLQWESRGLLETCAADAREDGRIHVTGCRPGMVTATLTAQGYLPHVISWLEIPSAYTHRFVFEQAVSVSGRVTYAGDPVRDFVVHFWQANETESHSKIEFRDREDGTFLVENAVRGSMTFLATAEGLGPAWPLDVDVVPGATVQLELTDGGLAAGQVVDAVTGKPLEDAQVTLGCAGTSFFVPQIDPVLVASDGYFEVADVSFLPGALAIEAPGYSRRVVEGQAGPTGEWNLGRIALDPAQELTLRLVGLGERDARRFSAELVSRGRSRQRFLEDGTTVFKQVGEGPMLARVWWAGAERWTDVRETLSVGKDWELAIPVGGEGRMDLTVLPEPGQDLPRGLMAILEFTSGRGLPVQHGMSVIEGGHIRFEPLARADFSLKVTDETETLATSRHSFGGTNRLDLTVTLGADRQAFRVVDRAGQPVPDLAVVLGNSVEQTGDDGVCAHALDGSSTAFLHLRGGQRGNQAWAQFPLPAFPGDRIELVFDPSSFVELSLRDGPDPVVGVSCGITAVGHNVLLTSERLSDESGTLRWDRLASDVYRVSTFHPDYFFAYHEVRAGKPTELQIRRKTDVDCHVRTSAGAPVAGAALKLASLEFDRTLRQWAAERYIDLPERGAVTDAGGRLQITGVPHGVYSWEVIPLFGDRTSGSATLLPGTANVLEITLP